MQFVKPTPDFETFCKDVETTAQLCEVPCNTELVRDIFSLYWPHCEAGWMAFRTTTKPKDKRELSARYIDLSIPHDPYQMALDHGYLTQDGHPIDTLISDLQNSYTLSGYGLDVGVSHGVEKIWPFVVEAVPVEDLYKLPSMPTAMQAYDDYFQKYNLKWTSLYAIDYYHKSMNIYFMFKELGKISLDTIASMIDDLGFTVPSEDELKVNTMVGALYYTFTWDSPRCERINFAVPHMPIDQFPTHLNPLLERMMQSTPTMLDQIRGSMQTAYTSKGDYMKIEVDYTGMQYSMVAAIEALPS